MNRGLPLLYRGGIIMKKGKVAALVLSAAFLLTAVSGCGDGGKNDDEVINVPENAVHEVGDFIALGAVDSFHSKIVNGSGMNGSDGRIHLHSASAGDMVKDDYGEFVFDAGHIERLGELHIWNYNAAGNTNNGLKEITVSLSEDGKNFTQFGTFTLAQADGKAGLKATNLQDGSYIDFGGVSGRYLKISAQSNYGGDGYGLSEIRLFRYKQAIYAGAAISASPIERYVNGKWSASEESYNLTNGAALGGSLSATAKCDNNPKHMTTDREEAIGFTLDLKGEYPLEKLVLWNYNDPEHLDYGLKDIRIRVSDDSNSWKNIGTFTLPQGTGKADMAPSLTVDMKNEHAHYVQIQINSNYGGERVGLSAATAFMGTGWYCDYVPDYTAMLSRYSGWSGADGIYTVNLDGKDYDATRADEDKKTFFVFSDTIVSEVDPVTRMRSKVYMPNNTSAVLTGGAADYEKIKFYYPQNVKECANIRPDPLEPSSANASKHKYYWLGDTFVIGNKLYVYSLKIDTVDPSATGFGFAQTGVDLARYDIVDGQPDFNSLTLINDTQGRLCSIANNANKWYFGGAVFQSTQNAGAIDPDGYLYVYGYNDVSGKGRKLVVARVKEENIEDFSAYEYLNADNQWVKTVPATFAYLADDVAPEVSVSQIQSGENRGKFVFVNSHITNSPTIKLSVSDSPYHVFGNKFTVFSHDTCASLLGKGNNTYNAKAHPALSKENELIFTYNINGDDAFDRADIYRPRFMRVALVTEG